jgi:hypothetical protein
VIVIEALPLRHLLYESARRWTSRLGPSGDQPLRKDPALGWIEDAAVALAAGACAPSHAQAHRSQQLPSSNQR